MSRVPLVSPESATGPVADGLDQIRAAFGGVPAMFRAVANSPAALQSMWGAFGALGTGTLGSRRRADQCRSRHREPERVRVLPGRRRRAFEPEGSIARGGLAADGDGTPRPDPRVEVLIPVELGALVDERGRVNRAGRAGGPRRQMDRRAGGRGRRARRAQPVHQLRQRRARRPRRASPPSACAAPPERGGRAVPFAAPSAPAAPRSPAAPAPGPASAVRCWRCAPAGWARSPTAGATCRRRSASGRASAPPRWGRKGWRATPPEADQARARRPREGRSALYRSERYAALARRARRRPPARRVRGEPPDARLTEDDLLLGDVLTLGRRPGRWPARLLRLAAVPRVSSTCRRPGVGRGLVLRVLAPSARSSTAVVANRPRRGRDGARSRSRHEAVDLDGGGAPPAAAALAALPTLPARWRDTLTRRLRGGTEDDRARLRGPLAEGP